MQGYTEPEQEEQLTEQEYNAKSEFPLYPKLSDAGKEKFAADFKAFGAKLKSELDNILAEWVHDYVEGYIEDIEHTAWQSMRQRFMWGIKNYPRNKETYCHDYKEIRKSILDNHRKEIINDLNQDNIDKIERLNTEIKRLIEIQNRSYY